MACDEVGGISRNGSMPWPMNKTDLKWFKEHTSGNVVVMGATTWNDPNMPSPLPNRINYVVTNKSYLHENTLSGGNLDDKLHELSLKYEDKIIWVIGGPKVINQCWDSIEEFYLTRIPFNYSCDTFLDLTEIHNRFILGNRFIENDLRFEIWKKRNEDK